MTWKKLAILVIAILVFYVLVRMWSNGIFSASNLQSIYTDALAKRQANVDLRYKKVSARIAEINNAVAQTLAQSAKTVSELKTSWEKKLNDTKLLNKKELEKASTTKEILLSEIDKRDSVIRQASGTISKMEKEADAMRKLLTVQVSTLNTAWEAKLKIIEEDRDFWKKQSTYWNKKYVKAKRWGIVKGGIYITVGALTKGAINKMWGAK